MLRHRIRLTLLLVAAMVVATGAQQTTGAGARAYVDEVQAWRLKHEQDYSSQYVPLAGLFFLKPGANPAGKFMYWRDDDGWPGHGTTMKPGP